MAISRILAAVLPGTVLKFAQRLRFPHLFLLTAGLFLTALILPDFIPFLDEILLGLGTLILANWRGAKKADPKNTRP